MTSTCLLYGIGDHDCAEHPGSPSVIPEPCTTQAARKLHLSVQLRGPGSRWEGRLPGRSGPTLCGETGRDQERLNNDQQWRRSPQSIADMTPCLRCAKKAERAGVTP